MNDPCGIHLLALLRIPGLGPAGVRELLAVADRLHLPLVRVVDQAPERLARHVSASVLQALLQNGSLPIEQARTMGESLEARGGRLLSWFDAGYPAILRRSLGSNAPLCISVLGNMALLEEPGVAFSGPRRPSLYALQQARECAAHCASFGPVVSGGAEGIDTAAHRAAVEAGGATVVALPQGLMTWPVPAWLRGPLADGRAVVVSAAQPDADWQTYLALERNHLIAALARLLCVVGAQRPGGSIHTAQAALAMGRPVRYSLEEGASPGLRAWLDAAGARPLVVDGSGNLKLAELAQCVRDGAQSDRHARELWLREPGTRKNAR